MEDPENTAVQVVERAGYVLQVPVRGVHRDCIDADVAAREVLRQGPRLHVGQRSRRGIGLGPRADDIDTAFGQRHRRDAKAAVVVDVPAKCVENGLDRAFYNDV